MIDYHMDSSHRIMTCRAIGALDFVELVGALHCAMAGHERCPCDGLFLFDDQNAFSACLHLLTLRPALRRWEIDAQVKWAFVFPLPACCAMAAHAFEPAPGRTTFRCFHDEISARQWLAEQSGPAAAATRSGASAAPKPNGRRPVVR